MSNKTKQKKKKKKKKKKERKTFVVYCITSWPQNVQTVSLRPPGTASPSQNSVSFIFIKMQMSKLLYWLAINRTPLLPIRTPSDRLIRIKWATVWPFWHVRPTKTQINLRIREVRPESSFSAKKKKKKNLYILAIKRALSEDSDQSARMRRLIWSFAGRTCPKLHFLTFRFIHFQIHLFAATMPCFTCLCLTSTSRKRRNRKDRKVDWVIFT